MSSSGSFPDQERGMGPTLPFDLIKEILLRLPVRSVLRFKCVCKAWRSLISDPQFAVSHHDLAAAPSHRLLLRSDDFYIESIDVEAPRLRMCPGALHFHFRIPPPPPQPHGVFDYYADDHSNAKHEILGSCRGLVLLQYWQTSDLIVWNPSTDSREELRVFDNATSYPQLFGFGYDPSTDDYLLVDIALDIESQPFSILSFKTGLWDNGHMQVSYGILDQDKFRGGSLLHESLHWLVFSEDKRVPVILAFDLVQRSFSEIPLLDDLTTDLYELYSLRVMGGCLAVCCSVQGTETAEIWMMKQYKVHTSWTKSVVLNTHGIPHNCFSPMWITKDGGIFGSNIRGTLEKVNDKGELLDHLTYGRPQRLYKDNLQVAMYTESLLTASVIGGNKKNQGMHCSSCVMENEKFFFAECVL